MSAEGVPRETAAPAECRTDDTADAEPELGLEHQFERRRTRLSRDIARGSIVKVCVVSLSSAVLAGAPIT
jgi:hypothetical protein